MVPGQRRVHIAGKDAREISMRSVRQVGRSGQQRRHRPIAPLDQLHVEEWENMIDINIKGVLYGIAAALPLFRAQGFGHFVNTASTAAHRIVPSMAVYAGTKIAVRAISEGLRQEAGDKLRVTVISPGFTRTNLAESMTDPETKAQIVASMEKFAMPPHAIARAIAFAIEQSLEVEVARSHPDKSCGGFNRRSCRRRAGEWAVMTSIFRA